MDFEAEYAYACRPERLHQILTDRAFLESRLTTSGSTVDEVGPQRVVTTREIKVPLTGPAARLLGETQRVTQVEEWSDPASTRPAFAGTFHAHAAAAPVTVSGTLRIEPADEGCRLLIRGRIDANVPFVGRKIAELGLEQIVKNLDQEHASTTTWLAQHRDPAPPVTSSPQ